MKTSILVLVLALAACGKKSGGAGSGGGAQAQSACQSGSLNGVFADSGNVLLSIVNCGFNHGVNSACVLEGNMTTTGSGSGTATLEFTNVAGACGAIPATMTCSYSLTGNVFGLTCPDLGLNQSYTRVP